MIQTRIADVGAGTSITLFSWASLAHFNEILHTLALVVAIVSGCAAAALHISQFIAKRRSK